MRAKLPPDIDQIPYQMFRRKVHADTQKRYLNSLRQVGQLFHRQNAFQRVCGWPPHKRRYDVRHAVRKRIGGSSALSVPFARTACGNIVIE